MSLLRTLHAWIGAIISLLLIITGASGAALACKGPWLHLTLPAAREAPPRDVASLGAALDALERADPPAIIAGMPHPGMTGMPPLIQRSILPSRQIPLFQTYYDHDGYGYADGKGRSVARWTGTGRLETLVYELHHFLLAGDRGMVVVAAGGLVAAFLALSGLIVWLPIARSFRLKFWPSRLRRAEALAAHRNLGALAALPVLLFSLTGAAMIFDQPAQYWLEALAPSPVRAGPTAPSDAGDPDWPRALAAAQAQYPKAEPRMIIWPASMFSPLVVRFRQPGEWAADGNTDVWIDPSTNRVVGGVDGLKRGGGDKLFNALLPLHAGRNGAPFYDLFVGLSGVALTLLGLYGLFAFLQVRLAPRRKTGAGRAPSS